MFLQCATRIQRSFDEEKKKLFVDHSPTYKVINVDDAYGRQLIDTLADDAGVIGFSMQQIPPVDTPCCYVTDIKKHKANTVVSLKTPWGAGQFSTGLVGDFNIQNILASICVAGCQGISLSDSLAAVSTIKPAPGRMVRVDGPSSLPSVVGS